MRLSYDADAYASKVMAITDRQSVLVAKAMPPCASPSGPDTPSPQPYSPFGGFLFGDGMTTVAWDGKELVADSQVSSADRIYRTEKIIRLPDGSLFGGAGGLADVLKLRKWVQDGMKEPPELGDNPNVECLWIKPDGTAWLLDESMEPMRVTDAKIAIGTGSQYAMAAMYLGKTAQEAVSVAAEFDPSTSLPVTVLVLKQAPKMRACKKR